MITLITLRNIWCILGVSQNHSSSNLMCRAHSCFLFPLEHFYHLRHNYHIYIYAQKALKTAMLETYIYIHILHLHASLHFQRSSLWFSLSFARQMIAKSYAERFNACSPPKKVVARYFVVLNNRMLWMDGESLLNHTEPLNQFQGFIKKCDPNFSMGYQTSNANSTNIYGNCVRAFPNKRFVHVSDVRCHQLTPAVARW